MIRAQLTPAAACGFVMGELFPEWQAVGPEAELHEKV
jgi:hypothetical protein